MNPQPVAVFHETDRDCIVKILCHLTVDSNSRQRPQILSPRQTGIGNFKRVCSLGRLADFFRKPSREIKFIDDSFNIGPGVFRLPDYFYNLCGRRPVS